MYGLYGAGANMVRGKDFFYIYKQWDRHVFLANIYTGQILFCSFLQMIFYTNTICADNKANLCQAAKIS